jgi:hypothetical protein
MLSVAVIWSIKTAFPGETPEIKFVAMTQMSSRLQWFQPFLAQSDGKSDLHLKNDPQTDCTITPKLKSTIQNTFAC